MKKLLSVILSLFILLMVAAGCSKSPSQPNEPGTPGTGTSKLTYTQEFTYLPALPAMKLKDFQKGQQGSYDYAYYTLSDIEYDKILDHYERLLKQDGWTVTEDKKPKSLTVTKADHLAAMVLSKVKNEPTLVITSK
jgi:hypothetical protein